MPSSSFPPRIAPLAPHAVEGSPSAYDRFFAFSLDLLCVLGSSGRLRDMNPAFERLVGRPAECLRFAVFHDFVHVDDKVATRAAWAHCVTGDHGGAFECRIRGEDGSYRWVAWRITPSDDEGLVYAVGRDVTEQRGADEALRRSRELLQFVLDSGRMAVWDWDVAAARATYGDGIGPLLGRPSGWQPTPEDDFPMRIHPDDRAAFLAESYRAIAEGVSTTIQCRIDLPDGALRWILSHGEPLRDPTSGQVTHFRGLIIDVTERMLLESRLREAQKMEAVGQLAGGIAHDFNNLLTVIRSCSELALDALPAGASARVDVEEILQAAARGAEVVRQLLAFGRRQVLRPTTVSLHALLREREAVFARILGDGRDVRLDLASGSAAVIVDPGQLEQVLLNLVLNARDAMAHAPRGTLTLSTARVHGGADGTVTALPSGAYVALEVRDDGAGMDAETQARAFEPFFTTKGIGKGTGLGLATVHGIVAQSGGAVTVTSTPGAGAAFTVYLPEAPSEPQPVEDGGAPPLPTSRLQAIRVLLVEDEVAVRRAVRRLLERHGCTVLEARHGHDALRAYEECGGAIDVLLTDVLMPEMGGGPLATRLRAACPGLPVVFMSGYTDDVDVLAEWSRGGDQFVPKPCTAHALLQAILAAV